MKSSAVSVVALDNCDRFALPLHDTPRLANVTVDSRRVKGGKGGHAIPSSVVSFLHPNPLSPPHRTHTPASKTVCSRGTDPKET